MSENFFSLPLSLFPCVYFTSVRETMELRLKSGRDANAVFTGSVNRRRGGKLSRRVSSRASVRHRVHWQSGLLVVSMRGEPQECGGGSV